MFTEAKKQAAHSEGKDTIADGIGAHSEGVATKATDQGAHSEGVGHTKWNNDQTKRVVTYVEATARGAHVEGTYIYKSFAGDGETLAGSGVVVSKATGIGAHAEGAGALASGNYSHAEGCGYINNTPSGVETKVTEARGEASHAEGKYTKASGEGSHSQGIGTIASGKASHAEGEDSVSSGVLSHAEGESTIAASRAQHVQGKYNLEDTENKYAHIVGNGTFLGRSNAHTIDWQGNAWFAGTITDGNGNVLGDSGIDFYTSKPYSLPTSAQIREYFDNGGNELSIPIKIRVANNHNNSSGTGNVSYFEYFDRTLTVYQESGCNYSETFIIEEYPGGILEEYPYTISISYDTTYGWTIENNSYGQITFLVDSDITLADGVYKGNMSPVTSDAVYNYVKSNIVVDWSALQGKPIIEKGTGSNSIKINNTNNVASANYSTAEGNATQAINLGAHAEGGQTIAGDPDSPNGNKYYQHAEGFQTRATGNRAHSEGHCTMASGYGAHAEGMGDNSEQYTSSNPFFNTASGKGSHVEGRRTTASGEGAHSEGIDTTASGAASHSEGRGTAASSINQHVEGRYNVKDTSARYAHIVGNGTSDSKRSNAHTLDWNGNAWFAGDVSNANGVSLNSLYEMIQNIFKPKLYSPTIVVEGDTIYIVDNDLNGNFTTRYNIWSQVAGDSAILTKDNPTATLFVGDGDTLEASVDGEMLGYACQSSDAVLLPHSGYGTYTVTIEPIRHTGDV
jgi:hypothetical protein